MTNAMSNLDRRIVAALFAVLLLLAGCSRDPGPKSYTAEVQSNYLENCGAGTKTKLSSADATRYCECTNGRLHEVGERSAHQRGGGFDRDISTHGPHCDADIRGGQRGSVVDAVTDHRKLVVGSNRFSR